MESVNFVLAFYTVSIVVGLLILLVSFVSQKPKEEFLEKQEYYNKNTKGSFNKHRKNR